MPSCGCKIYGTRNGDQEEHRCSCHEYETIVCRLCTRLIPEDHIIGDRVCEQCAREHLLCACDNCGRVLPLGASVERKEVGDGGRLMTWRYCHPCEKEIAKESVHA